MAKYMTDYGDKLAVTVGRLSLTVGRPIYVLTAFRIDPQKTDDRVILTDSSGKILKWSNKKDAINYAHKHNMSVYDNWTIIMGGTTG